jgi:hypothetical protein
VHNFDIIFRIKIILFPRILLRKLHNLLQVEVTSLEAATAALECQLCLLQQLQLLQPWHQGATRLPSGGN